MFFLGVMMVFDTKDLKKFNKGYKKLSLKIDFLNFQFEENIKKYSLMNKKDQLKFLSDFDDKLKITKILSGINQKVKENMDFVDDKIRKEMDFIDEKLEIQQNLNKIEKSLETNVFDKIENSVEKNYEKLDGKLKIKDKFDKIDDKFSLKDNIKFITSLNPIELDDFVQKIKKKLRIEIAELIHHLREFKLKLKGNFFIVFKSEELKDQFLNCFQNYKKKKESVFIDNVELNTQKWEIFVPPGKN
jgi:hypothetical protein